MNTICLKLVNGEELIAKTPMIIEPEKKRTYEVSTVRSIIVQPVGNNQMAIGFVPWMAGNTDAIVTIHGADIIATYVPEANIERGYLEQTSGIDLSSSRPGIKM